MPSKDDPLEHYYTVEELKKKYTTLRSATEALGIKARSWQDLCNKANAKQKMLLSKEDRKIFIGQISRASGVAQYALEAKMTDEQVIEAKNYIEAFKLLKASNDYNRKSQAQKTAEANAKLKEFLNLQNSEIFKAGKWLVDALTRKGEDRKQVLLEQGLVHKDDYNSTVIKANKTISLQKGAMINFNQDAIHTISILQERVDTLLMQQQSVRDYIKYNIGLKTWKDISKKFINSKSDEIIKELPDLTYNEAGDALKLTCELLRLNHSAVWDEILPALQHKFGEEPDETA